MKAYSEAVATPLLQILRCPFCRAELRESGEGLACNGCGRTFAHGPDGIPLMLHEELPGARTKLREAEGWAEKARAEGWYEPDDAVDAVLPFVNRDLGWEDPNWGANAHSFQVLLDRYVGDARGLRVLEVGAAKAWGNEAFRRLFMHAHQVYGAIGFSTECDLQLFTRHVKARELTWGSASAHRERVARAMGL